MTSDTVDLSTLTRPSIVEVWAPSCSACRAMKSDLDAAAVTFASQVDLVRVNATDDPESAHALRVLGVPTFIGVKAGMEAFRVTGRRNATELRALFAPVAGGGKPRRSASQDVGLRLAAGLVLLAIGLVAGPVWSLVFIGAGVGAYGVYPLLGSRT
jgi:thioredoxin 1